MAPLGRRPVADRGPTVKVGVKVSTDLVRSTGGGSSGPGSWKWFVMGTPQPSVGRFDCEGEEVGSDDDDDDGRRRDTGGPRVPPSRHGTDRETEDWTGNRWYGSSLPTRPSSTMTTMAPTPGVGSESTLYLARNGAKDRLSKQLSCRNLWWTLGVRSSPVFPYLVTSATT